MQISMYYKFYRFGREWHQWAKDYKLEPGDLISFYRHVRHLNSWHFLIRFLKKLDEAGTSKPTQEGGTSERTADKGRDCKGCDKPSQGSGGGNDDINRKQATVANKKSADEEDEIEWTDRNEVNANVDATQNRTTRTSSNIF
ncbi:hypothetical protein Acr_17g0000530 [Actinidia rufa]|uniref:Uncharacterized protein n=1 Tax=Actinidia rufa TaxID=165716 RepID=A0A7J0G0M4_9ERIC|nr:hypothetical protein Acr_17g0000530 [Actinidia rufa]